MIQTNKKDRSSFLGMVFYVLIFLINVAEMNAIFYNFLVIYETFQFCVEALLLFFRNSQNQFLSILSYIFNLLNLLSYTKNYLVVFIFLATMISISLVTWILLYIITNDKGLIKAFHNIAKIISYLVLIYMKIGVFPIFILCMNLFKCNEDSQNALPSSTIILYKVFSIIFFVINFIQAGLLYLFFNDDRVISHIPWAKPFGYLSFLLMSQKFFFSISITSSQYSTITHVLIVVIILISIYNIYMRTTKYAFLYSKLCNYFIIFQESFIFITFLLGEISAIYLHKFPLSFAFFCAIIIIFLTFIIELFYYHIQYDAVNNYYHLLKGPNQKLFFFRKRFLKIVKLSESYSDTKISREISRVMNHSRQCENSACQCRHYLEKIYTIENGRKSNNSEKMILIKEFFLFQLRDCANRNFKIPEFKIFLSYAEIILFDNFAKAYYDLQLAELKSNNFSLKISIRLHRTLIEEHLIKLKFNSTQNTDQFNVEKLSLFEIKFTKIQKHIKTSVILCFDYWNILLSPNLNVNQLIDKSTKISQNYFKIIKNFKKLLEMYPTHINLLKTYAYFSNIVLSNSLEYREYMHKAEESKRKNLIVSSENQDESKFGIHSDSGSLIISSDIKNLGIITNATTKITNILGYSVSELVGKNVEIILLPCFAKNHNSYLLKYFESGVSTLLNNVIQTFAYHQGGYAIPIELLIKVIPSFKYGLCFIGFIRRISKIFGTKTELNLQKQTTKKDKYNYILTNFKNEIIGFNKNAKILFQLDKTMIYDEKTSKVRPDFLITLFSENLINKSLEKGLFENGIDIIIDLEKIYSFLNYEKETFLSEANLESTEKLQCHVIAKRFEQHSLKYIVYSFELDKKIKSKGKIHLEEIKGSEGIGDANEFSNMFEKNFLLKQNELKGDEIDAIKNSELLSVSNASISSSSQSSVFGRNFNEFKRSLTEAKIPRSLGNLNKIVNVLLILIIVISIIDLIIKLILFNNIANLVYNIKISYEKTAVNARIGLNFQSLILVSNGEERNSMEGVSNRQSGLRNLLATDIDRVKDITDILVSSDLYSYDYIKYYNTTVSTIDEFKNIQNISVSYQELYTTILTKILRIIKFTDEELKTNYSLVRVANLFNDPLYLLNQYDRDLYFIIINLLNSIREADSFITSSFYKIGKNNLDNNNLYIIILTICCILFVLICIISIIPFIFKTRENISLVLKIYANTPIKIVKETLLKINDYLLRVAPEMEHRLMLKNVNENEAIPEKQERLNLEENKIEKDLKEMASDEKSSLKANTQEDIIESKPQLIGHSNQLQSFNINTKHDVLIIITFGVILIIYFGISYIISFLVIENVKSSLGELDPLCTRQYGLMFSLYTFRYLIMRGVVDYNAIDLHNNYTSSILESEDSIYAFIHNASTPLKDIVSDIKILNSNRFCEIANNGSQLCQAMENSLMMKGLLNSMYSTNEKIIKIFTEYMLQVSMNSITSDFLNETLNQDDFTYSVYLTAIFINAGLNYISNNVPVNMQKYIDSISQQEIVKFSIFCLIILLVLLFIWKKFMDGLMIDVLKSRGILNLIPVDFVSENMEARESILKVINY